MSKKINGKSWDPKLESQIMQEWNNDHIYNFTPAENNFVIDTPPPYPSGKPWHIGAAAHYAQIDMIARTARMSGANVYFPIGIDRNGLPVEIYTEKKYHIRIQNINREEFLILCRKSLDELENEILHIMKRLGISGDFINHYRTDSEEYRTLTQSTFIELWNNDCIYLANRPNNYDSYTKTTISDAEITYLDIKTKLVYIKFNLTDSDRTITISSTRPELLCSCQIIIVHPDDKRYTEIVGKKAIIPIFNKVVEICQHRSVKMEFGTGAVMVCSYGDQNDVTLFREMKLNEIISIDRDGKMTSATGKYSGLKVENARVQIIEDLKNLGVVEKIEKINHNIPVSERSKTPIEIIPMQEYYLKQKNEIKKIKNLCSKIKFYPQTHKQILIDWINSISMDWPISRRRYYGTEIPIWHCKKCLEPHVPSPGKYYSPWKDKCPIDECFKCGSTEFKGEEKILDTWMDSSISPLFITKFGKNKYFFKKTYPTSIRPQAKDIVRTWLYYTLLRCNQISDKIPWSNAWIMGHGLDNKGLKMSKSLKNAIDPLPIINEFGADAFRFWSASIVNHGYDFRCSVDKIESAKKFLSKLWNISKFVSNFTITKCELVNNTDKWILSEINKLIADCKEGYKNYNFYVPSTKIREFTWNIFASHYIEMVKNRAYGNGVSVEEQNSAIYTLHKSLSSILLLLAPITPFITDYIWKKIYSQNSIHTQKQVEIENCDDMTSLTYRIMEFNSKIWNAKKNNKISLNKQIEIAIPNELDIFKNDLLAMHSIKQKRNNN